RYGEGAGDPAQGDITAFGDQPWPEGRDRSIAERPPRNAGETDGFNRRFLRLPLPSKHKSVDDRRDRRDCGGGLGWPPLRITADTNILVRAAVADNREPGHGAASRCRDRGADPADAV